VEEAEEAEEAEQAAAEEAREQVAQPAGQELAPVHQPDMAAVHQPDMAARLAWATAPRLRGTRCKRRFRLMPAASITAHQASLRESVTAHQGLLRVNSLRDFKAPAVGRGFWMAWR